MWFFPLHPFVFPNHNDTDAVIVSQALYFFFAGQVQPLERSACQGADFIRLKTDWTSMKKNIPETPKCTLHPLLRHSRLQSKDRKDWISYLFRACWMKMILECASHSSHWMEALEYCLNWRLWLSGKGMASVFGDRKFVRNTFRWCSLTGLCLCHWEIVFRIWCSPRGEIWHHFYSSTQPPSQS